MGVHLRHLSEYQLELSVFCNSVTADDMLRLYGELDRKVNSIIVFCSGVDLSSVAIAQLPAVKRAAATGVPDRKSPQNAYVSLCPESDSFVDFWLHYARAGTRRAPNWEGFSNVTAACRWLSLPPAAADAVTAATAEAVEAETEKRVSRAEAIEGRRRILRAASRLFRARGFDGATEAEIMDAAGLPSGEFGRYFETKSDLIFHSLIDAMEDFKPPRALGEWACYYLSVAHKSDIASGCPIAALAQETAHQSPEARAAVTAAGLIRPIEFLSQTAAGHDASARRRTAIRAFSAAVGALMLARLSDDRDLADEFLDETRAWITGESAQAGASPRNSDRPADL